MSEHTAKICENGHVLTVSIEEATHVDKYCQRCGAIGVHSCQSCGKPILGCHPYHAGNFRNPQSCYACSKPYPWTGKTVAVAETPQMKSVKWTSPLYWFLVIKSKSLAAFVRLRGHNWTRTEIIELIIAIIAVATLVSMWLIYWR